LFSICGNDVLPQQSPAPLLLEVMKLRWHTHDRSERDNRAALRAVVLDVRSLRLWRERVL
jgi:hypothetical protein